MSFILCCQNFLFGFDEVSADQGLFNDREGPLVGILFEVLFSRGC